ncbi:MAG: DUF4131 domain-containing protein, partial [Moorella sp. (in: Bacteria)]|nr:DUF4131 domain-containing protein [Moorella sp. (in: firmicutes)]
CFMAGIAAVRLIPYNLPVYFLVMVIALLLAGWLMLKGRASVALLLAAVFVTGSLRFEAAVQAVPAGFESLDGKRVELCGKVISEPELKPDGRVVYVVSARAISVDGRDYNIRTGIRVSAFNNSNQGIYCPGYGDMVTLRGTLRMPSSARVPGGFDARFYYAGSGIYANLY